MTGKNCGHKRYNPWCNECYVYMLDHTRKHR